MKQVTPGTFGSSKLLTQTLSFGDSKLNIVLTQTKSSALATLEAARSTNAAKSNLIPISIYMMYSADISGHSTGSQAAVLFMLAQGFFGGSTSPY